MQEYGILPLFKNSIPGYSVEEHADPSVWFSGDDDVWAWKGPVIRNTGCAYGKFIGGKAVFISKEWFPDFANWRRDGYDFDARFDDELASYDDKKLFDLVDKMAPVISRKLKKEGNYGKAGNKGFETIITRLQAQGYILISDFVYLKDKHGSSYGWGLAEYSTPEKLFGSEFRKTVYACEPEESYRRILKHVCSLVPECDPKDIERFLMRGASAARSSQKKNWLVPSNPKYYDVIRAFSEEEEILWKQGNDNIREGDIVYLYLGAPYSAVLYRCLVTETDIPYVGEQPVNVHLKNMMKIRKQEQYPKDKWNLPVLRTYDVWSVRSARSCPDKLAAAMEKKNFTQGTV